MVNGITQARGHLHGKSIPPSHMFVMVTTVKENNKPKQESLMFLKPAHLVKGERVTYCGFY